MKRSTSSQTSHVLLCYTSHKTECQPRSISCRGRNFALRMFSAITRHSFSKYGMYGKFATCCKLGRNGIAPQNCVSVLFNKNSWLFHKISYSQSRGKSNDMSVSPLSKFCESKWFHRGSSIHSFVGEATQISYCLQLKCPP